MSVLYTPELLQLEAAVDALSRVDLRQVPEAHRLGNQEKLHELRNRLDAIGLRGLQCLDAEKTTVTEAGRATRSWLIEEQQVSPGEATKRMRVARALPTHPYLEKFLDAGDINLDHANAIVKATSAVAPAFREIVETTLVDMASHCPPHKLGEEIEKLLIASGAEPSSDEAHVKRMNRRGIRIARTFHGMRSVSGLLTPEVAEALEVALGVLSQKNGEDDDRHLGLSHGAPAAC